MTTSTQPRCCASCKFWRALKDDGRPAPHGQCVQAVHDPSGKLGWAYEDLEVERAWEEDEPTLAAIIAAPMVTQDGSGYRAELFTRPDHACAAYDAAHPEEAK